MVTYERMGDMLEEVAKKFPDEFFEELDGGIQLERMAKPNPEFPDGDVFIMGQYCRDELGRYIKLYYGSFFLLMDDADDAAWKKKIFATVAHEFTHHMEDTAMLHGLEDKDAIQMAQLRAEHRLND